MSRAFHAAERQSKRFLRPPVRDCKLTYHERAMRKKAAISALEERLETALERIAVLESLIPKPIEHLF